MSAANVEIVRTAFTAFNERDADAFIALCDPDAVFEPLAALVEGGSHRGPAGIRRWMAQMNEVFEDYQVRYDEIEDLGDVVLVRGSTSGRGRESGIPIERPWNVAVRFRDGKAWRWAFRTTRQEALEAVELKKA